MRIDLGELRHRKPVDSADERAPFVSVDPRAERLLTHNLWVSDPRLGAPDGEPTWKALPKARPWFKKLTAQRLAESEVRAPDGSIYGVRVVSDSPVTGLTKIVGLPANPLGTAADLIKANLVRSGSAGWTIEVVKPATRWRSERVQYAQPVGAAAIVVDVTIAITDAIRRGDKLWPEDEDY